MPDTTSPLDTAVRAALAGIVDPHTGRDLVALRALRRVVVEGGDVAIAVELGWHDRRGAAALQERVASVARAVPGVEAVSVSVTGAVASHAVQRGVALLPGVKNVIAVASGKGGVGKSTTAVNVALALAAEGASVGLLDADVYGPSQPTMLGLHERPESSDGKTMDPLEAFGLQVMSIGFLVDDDSAMIWRGPMATQALEQMLRQTRWEALDYLVVDLPPGTGDIQLTLAQRVPLTGAVIVTTPQDVALNDARRGVRMFEKVGVPILGVVENMAVHLCTQCGHAEHVFGEGGGERMAGELGVAYLGALPLDRRICERSDAGRPIVASDPEGALAALYREVALRVAVAVAGRAKDHSTKFPTITISKST